MLPLLLITELAFYIEGRVVVVVYVVYSVFLCLSVCLRAFIIMLVCLQIAGPNVPNFSFGYLCFLH